ncbi:hypothetical protein SISNIDRAFT_460628 [Sistotremastrum niveocremeum HHB9708]|uniref:Uncharacterized protein n=2 Tax=Sistotremastraceae TaxID=3402574 RepID=A0A164NH78_9AGAM|nr:hypothetical protein SISNIDRAFT_460628 [Sistotremastrum niveocremeum HHB9708]KZT35600.1 hypothetical protein SISSUDRAFT_1051167 [Sistotremastrum suecicum HHB10207 ss-3]
MSGIDTVEPNVPIGLGDLPEFCEKLKVMLANSVHIQTHDVESLDEAARIARESESDTITRHVIYATIDHPIHSVRIRRPKDWESYTDR